MKLKKYQENAIATIENFLNEVQRFGPKHAFISTTGEKYEDSVFGDVPFVCVKIPTGGGKTLIASHVLEKIMSIILQEKMDKGIVLWFTPSDAIKTQTINKLKDRKDWHRSVIDEAFDNNVKVFSNEEALSISKRDVADNLCIIVASLDAFRKEKSKQKKYKAYQENGALLEHFENLEEHDYLEKDKEGTVINSLANVVRLSSPLIVVDEGHKATATQISTDTLKGLNPAFVIEYTATPLKGSNVLVDIPASQLKNEQMVKIPIVLESAKQWQKAVEEGISQRNELEKITKKLKGEYIRPIALLQAQPKSKTMKKVTVGELKNFLLEHKIPEEQIAIKIDNKNELEGVNLFSRKCPIRYIITVNALTEGWDCSFAYVLISVANLGAKVSVEQIIGRVMRMPEAKRKNDDELNRSYVFTSAKNFSEAATQIISGLENNGYTKYDYIKKGGEPASDPLESKKASKIDFKAPFIANGKEKLYFEDLVGEDFELSKQDPKFDFEVHYDSDGKAVLDIKKDEKWFRGAQQSLKLRYEDKSLTKEELTQWLDRKLRFPILEQSDKLTFLKKAIDHQLKDRTMVELSVNRYPLRDALYDIVKGILEDRAAKTFQSLMKSGSLKTALFEPFPDIITLKRAVPAEFNRNLYERIDSLNKEEQSFVERLDLLPNIKFWVRSREKVDPFYIQGWKKDKFYPDFIAVTKKGAIIAIEWKGEDRLSNDDTTYKEEIGKIWAKLGSSKNHFFLTHNKNEEDVLKSIKAL
ncbi:MAG: DEAD/DEAH box helicase family protein [Patescibacteria group bacterium]